MKIDDLISSYPRTRPLLPKEHEAIHLKEYENNRKGTTCITRLVHKVESWMHHKIAKHENSGALLEIGAGTLNHLKYESNIKYDIVEPFQELYVGNPDLSRINKVYSDISEIPPNVLYERIISIAVLEHLENLPEVIARSALLMSEEGQAQHAFPSEGGFLWGLGWRLTTGISYRLRTGLPYKTLMRHEHINTAADIIDVLQYFYKNIRVYRFPLPSRHLSLYTYVQAQYPLRDRCHAYLKSISKPI